VIGRSYTGVLFCVSVKFRLDKYHGSKAKRHRSKNLSVCQKRAIGKLLAFIPKLGKKGQNKKKKVHWTSILAELP